MKHYRYILKTVHAGADLDFIVEASKWVPEQAGDPATVAGMYEVRGACRLRRLSQAEALHRSMSGWGGRFF